jgi:DNA-directed RNA polymerase specialized sigma subunit
MPAVRAHAAAVRGRTHPEELGDRLGCSQMHVSRLITRLLARLREGMITSS